MMMLRLSEQILPGVDSNCSGSAHIEPKSIKKMDVKRSKVSLASE